MALTPKQRRFVEEYLVDLNATQAAIRAGYSARTAGAVGHETLKKPEVETAIHEAMAERSKRTEITADRVLKEYAKLGFSDMRRFMRWGSAGVTLVEHTELTDDEAAAVAEVSQTVTEAGGSLKLKLHDKKGALDSIARHLGMFVDKHEHSGPGGSPVKFVIEN
jgi:phage terminase small subunit